VISSPVRLHAAKHRYELSSHGVDSHATLLWGLCNGGDDITSERAALRDFKPAYVGSGSLPELMHCKKKATYSITSSIRISSDSGNSMPSRFAVLRLTTNSNFVGFCTGRS